MPDERKERLVIGVLNGQAVEPSVLTAIMEMTNTQTQCEVDIRKLGHEMLLRALLDERIDVAVTLVPDGAALDEELDYVKIRRIRMHLLAAENDPIWNRETDFSALDGRLLIIQGEDHPCFAALIRGIKEAGALPQIKVAPNPEMAAQWLENGLGVSVTDEGEVMYSDRARRRLAAAPLQGAPEITVVIARKKAHTSRMLDIFDYYIGKTAAAGAD